LRKVTAEDAILARLNDLEQQTKLVLSILTKLAGESTTPLRAEPPPAEDEISVSRRMEIRQMAFEATRTPGKKKPSRREARV
jgi:hypothetical protein